MKKLKLIILISLLLQGRGSWSQSQGEDLKSFVTKNYIHGMPYKRAVAFGNSATPQLIKMLDDTKYDYAKSNIILMLGIVGDARAFYVIQDYLNNLQGELSTGNFNALFNVFQAFGHLSLSGNKDAVNLLIKYSNPQFNDINSGNLSYLNFTPQSMAILLNRLAIQGLAIAGNSIALNQLEKIEKTISENSREGLKSDIKNAIALNKQIKQEGSVNVFAKEGQNEY